jgi:hypothetical protein
MPQKKNFHDFNATLFLCNLVPTIKHAHEKLFTYDE